jgi:hypothetical protein
MLSMPPVANVHPFGAHIGRPAGLLRSATIQQRPLAIARTRTIPARSRRVPSGTGATSARLILPPTVVLGRAADVIERNGLAQSSYSRRQRGLYAENQPVCTLGAIAIAVGAEPYAWEEADLWERELAPATAAVEALLDFLGYRPEETCGDTIATWNDTHSAVTVIQGLRAAGREAVDSELGQKWSAQRI